MTLLSVDSKEALAPAIFWSQESLCKDHMGYVYIRSKKGLHLVWCIAAICVIMSCVTINLGASSKCQQIFTPVFCVICEVYDIYDKK
jgi:hypothetical protein